MTPELGWVGGDNDRVWETRDGGATWDPVSLGSNLNRFRVLSTDLAFASGATVYRFSGTP